MDVFTQASIKVSSSSIIYFDPYLIENDYKDADYIFITHDHYDHYQIESINKILKDNTIIIMPECMKDETSNFKNNIVFVSANNNYQIGDINFDVIPSYNIQKPFHPKEKGYVGYNVKIDNEYLYVMGDTDITNEAKNVKTDICFVPIGGKFTMDVNEAIDYINFIKPKVAVPIHYGSLIGDISLKDIFKEKIDKNIEVKIYIGE